jgi:ribosomal protein L15
MRRKASKRRTRERDGRAANWGAEGGEGSKGQEQSEGRRRATSSMEQMEGASSILKRCHETKSNTLKASRPS